MDKLIDFIYETYSRSTYTGRSLIKIFHTPTNIYTTHCSSYWCFADQQYCQQRPAGSNQVCLADKDIITVSNSPYGIPCNVTIQIKTLLTAMRITQQTSVFNKTNHIVRCIAESFLRIYVFLQLIEIFPVLLEPERSLPFLQEPANVPILTQLNPLPTTPSHFLKIQFFIIFPFKS